MSNIDKGTSELNIDHSYSFQNGLAEYTDFEKYGFIINSKQIVKHPGGLDCRFVSESGSTLLRIFDL